MTSRARGVKQFFIALLFFVIVGGLGFLIYRGVRPIPPPPTPNPTINLSPIEFLPGKLLNVQNNDYDFLVKVSNPNTDYGSPDVQYKISFLDSTGNGQLATVYLHTSSDYPFDTVSARLDLPANPECYLRFVGDEASYYIGTDDTIHTDNAVVSMVRGSENPAAPRLELAPRYQQINPSRKRHQWCRFIVAVRPVARDLIV